MQACQQHESICVMGQSESFLGSHLNNPCRPMRHSHAAAHIVLDGPMRDNCKKKKVGAWAHASTCTYDRSCCCWPMRAHWQHEFICMMGQSENVLHGDLNNPCLPMRHSCAAAHIVIDRPMCNNCNNKKGGPMGPCEHLHL